MQLNSNSNNKRPLLSSAMTEEQDKKPEVDHVSFLLPPTNKKKCSSSFSSVPLKDTKPAINSLKQLLINNLLETNLNISSMVSLSNTVFQALEELDDNENDSHAQNLALYEAVKEYLSTCKLQDEVSQLRSRFEHRDKLIAEKNRVVRELGQLQKSFLVDAYDRRSSLLSRIEVLMSKVNELKDELCVQESKISGMESRIKACENRVLQIDKELAEVGLDVESANKAREEFACKHSEVFAVVQKAKFKLKSFVWFG